MRARTLLVLSAILATGAACRSLGPVPVRVEMPGVSRFPPESFSEIIVTDFRDDALRPDFNPGPAFQAFLMAELHRAFKGPVSSLAIPADVTAGPLDPSFWKLAAGGRDRVIFLAGSIRLADFVRKAIRGKRLPVDGPFRIGRRTLVAQRHWTFTADLSVVSAANGETLYRNTFLEECDYSDLDKSADFAFHELSYRVRTRLFQLLLGTPTIEPRTLIKH